MQKLFDTRLNTPQIKFIQQQIEKKKKFRLNTEMKLFIQNADRIKANKLSYFTFP